MKLERAKKQKRDDESTLKAEGGTITKIRRASHGAWKLECFLCEEIESAIKTSHDREPQPEGEQVCLNTER